MIIIFGSFMNSVTISIHKMLTLTLARKGLIVVVVVMSVCGSLVKATTICGVNRCATNTQSKCDGNDCKCKRNYSFRKTFKEDGHSVQACYRECYGDNDCPAHSTCFSFINSQGYDRSDCDCQQGYVLSKHNDICIDIDECEDGNLCQELSNTFCNNTKGSFSCDCLSGYNSSTRNTSCYDIDECRDGNVCQDLENTFCNNTEGSYICDCLPGYTSSARNTSCGAQLGSRANERSSSRSLFGLYIGLPIAVVVSLVVGITVILIRRKRVSRKSGDEQAKNSEETIANNVSYENVIWKETNHGSVLSIEMVNNRSVSMGLSRSNKPHSNLNKIEKVEQSNHNVPENNNKKKPKDPKGNSLAEEIGSPTTVTSTNGQIQNCETYTVLDVLCKDNENTYSDLYDVNPTSKNLTQDKIREGFEAKCRPTSREEIPQESNSNTSLCDFPKTLKEDPEQGIHKDSETEVIYENKNLFI